MLNIMHAKTCNKKKSVCLNYLWKPLYSDFSKVQSSIVHLIFSYLWKLNALELFMDDIGDVNVVIVGVLAAAVQLIIPNKH